ncbi:hypothetical protein [Mycolicibacterium rhodesiae]|nr:hypothetical protein [Mycolicibacterium rhodesiae]
MNRPYTAHSPYSLTPTERIATVTEDDLGEYGYDGFHEYPDDDDYTDVIEYDEESIDRRWMWIAGIAGAILFIAIGTTGIILGGGDSGSVTATGTSSAPTTATSAPAAASTPAAAPPSGALPAETVTTVSPAPEAPTAVAAPAPAPAAAPPAVQAPAPSTITYRVTGNKQLIDLVTVIYTDAQGALQTEVNVALPWTKTVVLNPGVELKSVTATSVGGQLNCGIYDASGALVTYQNNNSMIATCTQ